MDKSRVLNAQLEALQAQVLEIPELDAVVLSSNVVRLQPITKLLDKTPKLPGLVKILQNHEFSHLASNPDDEPEWFVLARAVVIVVDGVIGDLFSRSLPLAQEIRYWEQIEASRYWRTLYGVQTLPMRLWRATVPIKEQFREQYQRLSLGTIQFAGFDTAAIAPSIFPHLQNKGNKRLTRLLTVDTMIRQEVKDKIHKLLELRDAQARIVGAIVAEVSFTDSEELKGNVISIAGLLGSLCEPIPTEKTIYSAHNSEASRSSPADVATKLIELSERFLSAQRKQQDIAKTSSRPSMLARYWLVGLILYVSGSRVLSVIADRQKDIHIWIEEALQTCKGFWENWIVEPVRKILATIRHDEGSEVALLGKRSLSADMESLERMVVEFAQDNPQWANSSNPEIMRSSARDGDLTPVLRAYENNIKSPLKNVVAGSLVRSLLIQVQKTKVDVEIAINGIDKLLKSQELVFGFLGISPAIVLLWGLSNWFVRSRKQQGLGSRETKVVTIKTLRNIDRLLCKSVDRQNISYKTRGLVLYEVQVLRSNSKCIASDYHEQYIHDLSDLERAQELATMRAVLGRIISTLSLIM